jgi:hypothetical protein
MANLECSCTHSKQNAESAKQVFAVRQPLRKIIKRPEWLPRFTFAPPPIDGAAEKHIVEYSNLIKIPIKRENTFFL